MRRAFAIAVVSALLFGAPHAVARAAATDDEWNDPFCAASATVIPWNAATDAPAVGATTDRYALELRSSGRQSVAGRVVLIADSGAYAVTISRLDLLRESATNRFYTEALPVTFSAPVTVRYAYVDNVAVDDGKPVDCPTEVSFVTPYRSARALVGGLRGVAPLHALLMQALPTLSCGKPYIPSEMLGEGPLVGHFGDNRRTTSIRVYIDSNGIPVKERIERSSNVDGLDDAAMGSVQQSHYRPAQFLCTPVVSEMLIDIDYVP